VTDLVKNYGYIYYIPLDSSLIKKLRSFHNYRDSLQFLSPLEGARLVLDTLTGLEKYIPSEKMEPTPQSQIIKKAQEFIFNNITEPIGVEEIAAELSISREHLSRIFKEQLGEPPSSYLMKKKMEAACKLLIYSNLSCKEIAGRIGYESAVSFTRAFKNAVKMTPGELRTAGYIPEIR
jgi:AraC-like DNA-binding protein